MKVIKELQLKVEGKNKVIYFGIPDNDSEMTEMYKLRYNVYASRGYIDVKKFPEKIERDEYDNEGKCDYFIAKIDERIIGTVRLIRDYFLPTEKECFNFSEPKNLKEIPREKRAELGRLIVVPYGDKLYLPRNLVTLFLLSCLLEFCLENDVLGGYAFIKDKLKNKLEKLKMPIHLISDFTQKYPQNGLLAGYFSDKSNPVVPMYFIVTEFKKYIDKTVNNSLMFKILTPSEYLLRENLYNKFLKFLKII